MIIPNLIIGRHGPFLAFMHRCPTTPGQVQISYSAPGGEEETIGPISSLPEQIYQELFAFAKRLSFIMCAVLNVRRCALASDDTSINLIPLHGLNEVWEPIMSEEVFYSTYPGFLTSKTSPRMPTDELIRIRDRIASVTGIIEPYNLHFDGESSDQNLFACLVRGEQEQFRVFEDDEHVGWLTPFPNTPGFTVLVPRAHLSSDVFSLEEGAYTALVGASWKLGGAIKKAFGVKRVGIFFEGYEIDYTHVKLIPVRQEVVDTPGNAPFYEAYPGYISTQSGPEEKDKAKLGKIATQIREKLTQS